MPLNGYGLLVGQITGSRPQTGGNPHWLLMVQPGNPHHPPYRVAVNLQSTERGAPPAIEYQVVDAGSALQGFRDLVTALKDRKATPNFLPAAAGNGVPTLDFVRGNILDPSAFEDVPAGGSPFHTAFEAALEQAAATDQKDRALVAIFGTGYPLDPATGASVPTGFTGIDNIHMNQGALNTIHGDNHYQENGANQDGGVIFLFPEGAKGFFVKFHSQTVQTDANGNPTVTGNQRLDATKPEIRAALLAPLPPAPPKAAGFVFADPNPDDEDGSFTPDDDGGAFKTPFVMNFGSGKTRGPVPTTKGDGILALSTVVGANPPGYSRDASGAKIAFDMVGDTGAPDRAKLAGEDAVTALMSRNAETDPPAFLFHVGDVVYYYGEEAYYYSQFYQPFRLYPAPIFAIPGNHDGVTYNAGMDSLAGFKQAFCAPAPVRWQGSGGILRTAMIQPGVYFTLDAPLVSIIGLYSNCGETLGYLDDQQITFLYHELVRLKALRQSEGRAVILAIHHPPHWFPGDKVTDPVAAVLDRACSQAGFWPDAVISGHAHLQQKIVRTLPSGQELPYLIYGAGGYEINPRQEVAKDYMQTIAGQGPRVGRTILKEGYARVTVTKPNNGAGTVQFATMTTDATLPNPADLCTIDLGSGKVS